ncbi:MAG: amidohydrolase family protein [Actinomycetota bacterium]|nr:amidohydrolase family protein [Actinomycetota bacterium]
MGPDGGLLVQPSWLVDDPSESPKADWGIRVVGTKVDAVGPNRDLAVDYPDDEVMDAPDSILLPGFVNAHVHLYGVLAHGLPTETAPSGFWPFLEDFWWPLVEDRLDHRMLEAAADWVCGEMLRTGTTTFCDVLEAPGTLPDVLPVEKAVVDRWGLRGVLCFEATERSGTEIGQRGLEENARFIEACRDDEFVSGMMSIHTTFSCSDAFISQAFRLAEEHDVLLHAHCNEGTHEGEWCEHHHGRRTVEHYDYLQVAGPRLLASQCVHLSDREKALIAERGVRCAHMPLANCEVGGGIAPVPELLDAGVTVGLGSDGYVNDMFEVMRGAFLLHKGRLQDPRVMPAPRVLEMATVGGARALGLEGVGCLAPDWSADFQLVDGRFPTPTTAGNLLEQLVLHRSGQHVEHVMVGGRWVVRDGAAPSGDPEALRAQLHEQAQRLWGVK